MALVTTDFVRTDYYYYQQNNIKLEWIQYQSHVSTWTEGSSLLEVVKFIIIISE